VRVSIIDQDPPPLSQQSVAVPRQLDRIVSKALAKDRGKRYQTITDLKLDLEQLRDELADLRDQSGHLIHTTAGRPTVDRITSTDATRIIAKTTVDDRGSTAYYKYSKPKINSVAILPFVNDSDDPTAEYLSDGITESIINSLSRLPELKVMSRNAVFRFKGKNPDPQEVGRNLRVGAVLMGRLVKLNDRLIIKTELIDVADGSQLWGAEYNLTLHFREAAAAPDRS
jgi:TolB-like protein